MLVVAIKDFKDITNKKALIEKGTILDCNDQLAMSRIEKGFCVKLLNPEILKPKKKNNRVVE